MNSYEQGSLVKFNPIELFYLER